LSSLVGSCELVGLLAQAKGDPPPEPNEAPKKMALLKELHDLASFCQNRLLKLRWISASHATSMICAWRAAKIWRHQRPPCSQSLTLGIIVSLRLAKPLISAPRSSWRLPTGRVFVQLQPHLDELQTIVSPRWPGSVSFNRVN